MLALDNQDVHQVVALAVAKVVGKGVKHSLAKAFLIGCADLRML